MLSNRPTLPSPVNILGTSQDLLGTSSKVIPVAPFELQLALSTLQHKSLIPKPTLRPILTQVLHSLR
ncbi:hypothetical protein EV359DRAFT_88387 [Lentinula novae-zelandiae]|nr:hypothetical protein EV359DRAFT_88387 [Lentinula novae-zelandiae]